MTWYEAFTKPMDVVAKAAVTTEEVIKERVTRAWQDITDRLFYDLKCQRKGETILFNNVRVPLGETEKLVSGVEYETYRVEVTPKQAVRIGELEFEAWREDRYNIKITQGDVTIENEALRQKIIQQLRHFPHFLTNPQFKSRDLISDMDETARHWYTLWLIEHNSIYRVNQTRGLLPPHYTREDLRHDVMGLAIEKNDPSIVENYYGKVHYALEIQKQLLVEKQRVLNEMIAESEAAKREARKQFWKKVGWVVLGLVLVAAVLVGLYFLSPVVFGMAIGVLGLGNILSFFKGAALGILEVLKAMPFLNLLFIGLLAITAVGVYRSYSRHKENLVTIKAEETEKERKKIEKAQNALEFEKAMIISKVTGIRDKIAGLSETEGVLNLSGYMLGGPEVSGMIGIIKEHASEITELNLSDNKIDATTLKTLVEMLKTQSVLCVLDLRGNAIEQCNGKPDDQGIRALHTMLRSNFTITELKYDAKCFADNQPLKDKIVEQINMNRYLHGEGLISEELIGEKGREEVIRQKALSKLQYNFYITSLAGHIREEMQGEVRKICARNRVLRSLRHSSSDTTLAEFVSVYHSSPEACDRFLQLDWSYSKSVKKRLQTLLTTSEDSKEAIFALHSLERKSLQGLIQSIQGRVLNEQNGELLFGILQIQAHFPEEDVSSLSNRSYQSLLGTLQTETLAYLKGESNFDAFLKKTVQWRVQLEKLQNLGLYKGQRDQLVKALDRAIQKPMEIDILLRFPWLKSSDSVDIVAQAALFEVLNAYPHLFEFPLSQVKNEDGKHSIESILRANKLRDLFRRGSETLQIGDFIDFLGFYKTIHGAERALSLSTLSGSKELVKVIQELLGRFPEGHLYRELSKVEKEARTTLLDQCFCKERHGEIKGRLVSEIVELPLVLDTQDSSREARALRNCLKHAFTEASGYVFGLFGGEARWSAVKIAQELKEIQGQLKKSNELHGPLGEILKGYESGFRSGRRKTLGRD